MSIRSLRLLAIGLTEAGLQGRRRIAPRCGSALPSAPTAKEQHL